VAGGDELDDDARCRDWIGRDGATPAYLTLASA
jgi:hypothetical protein